MTDTEPWVLMVEDDALFAKIFEHFWKQKLPQVGLRVSGSLKEMEQALAGSGSAPAFVILDDNLPDGLGSEVSSTLSVPNRCWSALGEGAILRKPQGRKQLEAAVNDLARLAGFPLPSD